MTGPKTGPTKQRKQTTNKGIVVGFTEEQHTALDTLLGFGFEPQSDAEQYIQAIDPSEVLEWIAYARAHGLGPGYVRKRFDARDSPPSRDAGQQERDRSRYISGEFADYIEH